MLCNALIARSKSPSGTSSSVGIGTTKDHSLRISLS